MPERKLTSSMGGTEVFALIITAAILCVEVTSASTPASAMEGPPRTSDAELRLDYAFNFSQGGRTTLPSPDCSFSLDARSYFQRERNAGNEVRLLEHIAAKRFVEAAYRGRIEDRDYANLDFIAVEKLKDGTYRVYPGSAQIMNNVAGKPDPIFCGFTRPQTLSAEWAEAGLQYKTLYSTLPDPSPFDRNLTQLSLGYDEQSYEVVRNSLQQRGFKPVSQTEAVVERCSPGLEGICETYTEAACQQSFAGKTCAFEWEAPSGEHIAVGAEVGYLSASRAQITVHNVQKLDQGAR